MFAVDGGLNNFAVLVLLALGAVQVGRDLRAVLVRLGPRAVERDVDDGAVEVFLRFGPVVEGLHDAHLPARPVHGLGGLDHTFWLRGRLFRGPRRRFVRDLRRHCPRRGVVLQGLFS